MLTRSPCPVHAEVEVLFYLYAADLNATRQTLIANGIKAGEICYPEYLPQGEGGLKSEMQLMEGWN